MESFLTSGRFSGQPWAVVPIDPSVGRVCDSRGKSRVCDHWPGRSVEPEHTVRGTGALCEIPRRGNEGWLRAKASEFQSQLDCATTLASGALNAKHSKSATSAVSGSLAWGWNRAVLAYSSGQTLSQRFARCSGRKAAVLALERSATAGEDNSALAGAVALLVGTQHFFISVASHA
jgi:hypothetical protein